MGRAGIISSRAQKARMTQKKLRPTAKKSFALRVEPELYAALERMAASEFRSVNAQIEVMLREAMAKRGVCVEPPVKRLRGRPPITKGQGKAKE